MSKVDGTNPHESEADLENMAIEAMSDLVVKHGYKKDALLDLVQAALGDPLDEDPPALT